MLKKISLLLLLILIIPTSVSALDWISFVIWKGEMYEVTTNEISHEEVGKELGKVKREANNEKGTYVGDASNVYPKGTKYFEIINVSTTDAIAVHTGNNQFIKAIYLAPAQPMVISRLHVFLIIIACLGAIIFIGPFYTLIKRTK